MGEEEQSNNNSLLLSTQIEELSSSSRIIVKNIPKYITQERFRKHFSLKGNVITDAKLMMTRDGVFRRFGYIGYKTAEEAKNAVKYFKGTFMDTSRLDVEIAKKVGDSSLARPWSQYSQGSSAYSMRPLNNNNNNDKNNNREQFKNELNFSGSINGRQSIEEDCSSKRTTLSSSTTTNTKSDAFGSILGKTRIDNNNNESNGEKKQSTNKIDELLKEEENRPALSSYIDALHKKSNKRTWENEEDHMASKFSITNVNQKSCLNTLKNNLSNFGAVEDDDDEYQTLPSLEKKKDNEGSLFDENLTADSNKLDLNEIHESNVGIKNDIISLDKEGDDYDNCFKDSNNIQEDESLIKKTARLYVVNLSYNATEDEVLTLFEKYGKIIAHNVPRLRDGAGRMLRGIAFITYSLPEQALKAFQDLHNSIFQGRVLSIRGARSERISTNIEKSNGKSFKEQRDQVRREGAGKTDKKSWNSLFVAPSAVAEAVASHLRVSKADILDRDSDNMAVRLALAETHVIAELQNYFESHGVSLDKFEQQRESGVNQSTSRLISNTIILLKNLVSGTTQEEIKALFEPFGQLGRVLVPPEFSLTALVEMVDPEDAKKAFRSLAYRRFKSLPLYLEWAPSECFKEKFNSEKHITIEKKSNNNNIPPPIISPCKKRSAEYILGNAEDDNRNIKSTEFEPDAADNTKLIVRNVSFDATLKDLRQLFGNYSQVKHVRLPRKLTGGHRGFGFLEFYTVTGAKEALDALKNTHLYGRKLVLEYAKCEETVEELRSKSKLIKSNKRQKIILDEELDEVDN